MEFTRFDRVRRWEEIAVALLKKYSTATTSIEKPNGNQTTWNTMSFGKTTPTSSMNTGCSSSSPSEAIVDNLGRLKDLIEKRTFAKDWDFGNLQALWFGQHLYQPLAPLQE